MNIYYDGGPLCSSTLPSPFPEADRSLGNKIGSLETVWPISSREIKSSFFREGSRLDYILDALTEAGDLARIVSHPAPTVTCTEKSEVLGFDRSRVIKALYFVHKDSGELYAVVVPDFGPVDLGSLSPVLGFNAKKKLRLASEEHLVGGMKIGTCSPFIPSDCTRVAKIIFDENVVGARRVDRGIDDFSIALGLDNVSDRQLSVQMNYASAFDFLGRRFNGRVVATQIEYDRRR